MPTSAKCVWQVNDEASDKVLQIEVEYNQKRQPIYKERSEHLKKLPDFWQLCILQHPVLRSLVTEEDEEALRYIEDVCARQLNPLSHATHILPASHMDGACITHLSCHHGASLGHIPSTCMLTS